MYWSISLIYKRWRWRDRLETSAVAQRRCDSVFWLRKLQRLRLNLSQTFTVFLEYMQPCAHVMFVVSSSVDGNKQKVLLTMNASFIVKCSAQQILSKLISGAFHGADRHRGVMVGANTSAERVQFERVFSVCKLQIHTESDTRIMQVKL